MAPHATTLGDLTSLQIQFECEPEERWTRMGFGAAYVEQKALDAMELASQVKSGELIDFSDMIFLPVRNGWLVKQYDRVIVDEAQDLTTTQLEITLGILRDGGKMCIVGDDCQAVYAFRGADSESLDRLKEELSADELGLKTTYRCGRAIVEEARMFVPDFEAGPNNPEGLVSHLGLTALPGAAGPGDFVLSRVNAPLVSIAMRLLRAGKRARVAGRDIGMGLTSLVRRMKGASVEDLLNKIGLWEAREVARLEMLLVGSTDQRQRTVESKIEAIRDQASMLISLADGADSVNHVEDRIDALFKDDGMGIAGMVTCSSVHKAKGLEADRVFVLQDTMKHHNQEELNIQYVAITRAKHELVYVVDDRKETR
jgi:superfamily I DNA/RNA helicase